MKRTMTRTLQGLTVAVMLLCTLFIMSVSAAGANEIPLEAEHEHSADQEGWTGISTAQTLSSGKYYLSGDVAGTISVAAGADVTLCLNGKNILATGGDYAISMTANTGAQTSGLTLCNCAGSGGVVGPGSTGTARSIMVRTGATVNMYDGVTLTRTNTEANGGGVTFSGGGEFNMYGGKVDNCQGNAAVYIADNSVFNLYGGAISNNKGTNTSNGGGGVWVYGTKGKLNVFGGEIKNNTAANFGGGVYASGAVTMSGGTISGNTATETNGGGVYVNGCTFTMTGGTVSGDGNLVYLSGSTSAKAVISGGLVEHTSGKTAVYVSAKANATLSGQVTVKGELGGGNDEYPANVRFTVQGGSYSVSPAPGAADGYQIVESGLDPAPDCKYRVVPNQLGTCEGGHVGWEPVTQSCAITKAGKYYLDADITGVTNHYGISVDAAGVTLCLCGHSIAPAGSGSGALRVQNTDSTAELLNCKNTGAIDSSNMTTGRCIYLGAGAAATINDGVHLRHAHQVSSTNNAPVQIQQATLCMKGGSIVGTGTTAAAGSKAGAVWVNGTGAEFIMSGGTISGNYAATNGGAVTVTGATFEMSGGTIRDNHATYGGGVYVQAGSTFTMSGDAQITQNSADYGGGMYTAGTVKLSVDKSGAGNPAITKNTTTGNGAGVYVSGSVFTMDCGEISDNTSSGGAGGVYVIGNTAAPAVFTLNKGVISGNKGAYGGGVRPAFTNKTDVPGTAADSKFIMNGGEISNNTAEKTGNAVYNEATVDLNGGTVVNTDDNSVYTASAGTTTLGGAAVDATVATLSGKIRVSGGKFSNDVQAGKLKEWLVADAGMLSVMNNTGADAATYPYVVGEGYNRVGEFMDFKSSLDLTITLGADVGFTADGVTVTVNGESVAPIVADLNMNIPVSGIVAKAMDDEYTVAVTKDGKTLYAETLSVRKLAGEWYADEDTSDQTMLEDMINYGIEAQKTFEGTATMSALGGGTTQTPVWTATSGAGVSDGQQDKVAATLSLKEKIELNIYINDADATVTDVVGADAPAVEYVNGITRISFRDIPVSEAKNAVSFTVKLDDRTSFDVKYSIADYAVQAQTGSQSELIKALMKYVDSVSAYLAQ